MASPQLTPDQIAEVSSLVANYIKAQREKALPLALPLSPTQRASMDGFFLPQVLDTTRLLVLNDTRVENPHFYLLLLQMGFTNLPDFSSMAAVSFCNVVVSHQPFSDALLFHELVHVEQYRQLGIPRFAELYVRGFLSGGGYDGIPLEINAYDLGGRFERNPKTRFSVRDEVGVGTGGEVLAWCMNNAARGTYRVSHPDLLDVFGHFKNKRFSARIWFPARS